MPGYIKNKYHPQEIFFKNGIFKCDDVVYFIHKDDLNRIKICHRAAADTGPLISWAHSIVSKDFEECIALNEAEIWKSISEKFGKLRVLREVAEKYRKKMKDESELAELEQLIEYPEFDYTEKVD